jgi:hypothetical protein
VFSSGPCTICGRTVHTIERRWRRRWHFCCDDHQRQQQSTYQAAIARQRRAQARGASRPCPECGEFFEPARVDAQFCSARCKQKAYRKRVTLSKLDACNSFEIRNAALAKRLDAKLDAPGIVGKLTSKGLGLADDPLDHVIKGKSA